jgi:hypothetical protein
MSHNGFETKIIGRLPMPRSVCRNSYLQPVRGVAENRNPTNTCILRLGAEKKASRTGHLLVMFPVQKYLRYHDGAASILFRFRFSVLAVQSLKLLE